MGRAFTSQAVIDGQDSGVEVYIDYNDNNLRVQRVNWVVPAGLTAHALVWGSGDLVYDEVKVGPDSGSENVPGNHTMVEVTDANGTYFKLPDYITWKVEITN